MKRLLPLVSKTQLVKNLLVPPRKCRQTVFGSFEVSMNLSFFPKSIQTLLLQENLANPLYPCNGMDGTLRQQLLVLGDRSLQVLINE